METTKKQLLRVSGVKHEETAWKRYIYFDYASLRHKVLLFWDEFNGYELYWESEEGRLTSQKAPDWARNWNEDEHNGMSLEHYLDELTYDWHK